MAVMMPGEGAFQSVARRRIEPLEGKPRRGKFGFPAVLRNGARRKDRGQRRHALERRVGVPKLIGLVAHRVAMVSRHDFAIRTDGGENDEMRSGTERADLGDFRRTQAARKRELSLVAHILIAEYQNRIVFKRRAHVHIYGVM